jgi:transcriptional regulator with XRE-family HTH domain
MASAADSAVTEGISTYADCAAALDDRDIATDREVCSASTSMRATTSNSARDILDEVKMKSMGGSALGKRIHQLRKVAGWSQELLAERAGLNRSYISLLEAGKRDATLGTLKRIASAFQLPVDELVSGCINWASEVSGAGADSAEQRGLSPELTEALQQMQLNLLVIGELDAGKLDTLRIEIAAVREAAERKAREERGGVHRSSNPTRTRRSG